jgi:hypothetical protein
VIPGNQVTAIQANPSLLFVGCADRMNQMTWQGGTQANLMQTFAVLAGENTEFDAPTPTLPE